VSGVVSSEVRLTPDDVRQFIMSSSSSSATSTPVHEATCLEFQPVYSITVTEPVKNGDIVHYTVKSTKLSDDVELTVTRQYDDFEYLHHCLQTENYNDGIIVSSAVTISDFSQTINFDWILNEKL